MLSSGGKSNADKEEKTDFNQVPRTLAEVASPTLTSEPPPELIIPVKTDKPIVAAEPVSTTTPPPQELVGTAKPEPIIPDPLPTPRPTVPRPIPQPPTQPFHPDPRVVFPPIPSSPQILKSETETEPPTTTPPETKPTETQPPETKPPAPTEVPRPVVDARFTEQPPKLRNRRPPFLLENLYNPAGEISLEEIKKGETPRAKEMNQRQKALDEFLNTEEVKAILGHNPQAETDEAYQKRALGDLMSRLRFQGDYDARERTVPGGGVVRESPDPLYERMKATFARDDWDKRLMAAEATHYQALTDENTKMLEQYEQQRLELGRYQMGTQVGQYGEGLMQVGGGMEDLYTDGERNEKKLLPSRDLMASGILTEIFMDLPYDTKPDGTPQTFREKMATLEKRREAWKTTKERDEITKEMMLTRHNFLRDAATALEKRRITGNPFPKEQAFLHEAYDLMHTLTDTQKTPDLLNTLLDRYLVSHPKANRERLLTRFKKLFDVLPTDNPQDRVAQFLNHAQKGVDFLVRKNQSTLAEPTLNKVPKGVRSKIYTETGPYVDYSQEVEEEALRPRKIETPVITAAPTVAPIVAPVLGETESPPTPRPTEPPVEVVDARKLVTVGSEADTKIINRVYKHIQVDGAIVPVTDNFKDWLTAHPDVNTSTGISLENLTDPSQVRVKDKDTLEFTFQKDLSKPETKRTVGIPVAGLRDILRGRGPINRYAVIEPIPDTTYSQKFIYIPVVRETGGPQGKKELQVLIIRADQEMQSLLKGLTLTAEEEKFKAEGRIYIPGPLPPRAERETTEFGRTSLVFGGKAYTVSLASERGGMRELDEDFVVAEAGKIDNQPWNLIAVFDGLGGHAAGDEFSKLAANTLRSVLGNASKEHGVQFQLDGIDNTLNTQGLSNIDNIKTLFNYYRHKLREEATNRGLSNAGSTVAGFLDIGGHLYRFHCGDSRGYKLNGELEKLTVDHSLVARMVGHDSYTEENAARDPRRNIIYRSLHSSRDNESSDEIDVEEVVLKEGESLLLVCDGIPGQFAEGNDRDAMEKAVRAALTTANPALALVGTTIVAGGGKTADNVSAIIAQPAPENQVKLALTAAQVYRLDPTTINQAYADGRLPEDVVEEVLNIMDKESVMDRPTDWPQRQAALLGIREDIVYAKRLARFEVMTPANLLIYVQRLPDSQENRKKIGDIYTYLTRKFTADGSLSPEYQKILLVINGPVGLKSDAELGRLGSAVLASEITELEVKYSGLKERTKSGALHIAANLLARRRYSKVPSEIRERYELLNELMSLAQKHESEHSSSGPTDTDLEVKIYQMDIDQAKEALNQLTGLDELSSENYRTMGLLNERIRQHGESAVSIPPANPIKTFDPLAQGDDKLQKIFRQFLGSEEDKKNIDLTKAYRSYIEGAFAMLIRSHGSLNFDLEHNWLVTHIEAGIRQKFVGTAYAEALTNYISDGPLRSDFVQIINNRFPERYNIHKEEYKKIEYFIRDMINAQIWLKIQPPQALAP